MSNNIAGVGLDVGTSFIVGSRQTSNGDMSIKIERDAFFEVKQGDFTKSMLNESGVGYLNMDDKLFVVGDKALEFASILSTETRRPLSKGIISPKEEWSLPILRKIIEAVIDNPVKKGEKVVFSIPGIPIDNKDRADSIIYHKESIQALLESLGYIAEPMNEALAIIYSEGKKYQFSGIGISFGAGMINVCVSWLSVPIMDLTFSLTRGGDWIDIEAARAVNESSAVVCEVKESKDEFSLKENYESGIQYALKVYYTALIDYLLQNLQNMFNNTKRRFPKAMPIIISGGTSNPDGFLDLFKNKLEQYPLSNEKGDKIKIDDVIKAKEPLYSVSRGCLLKALID